MAPDSPQKIRKAPKAGHTSGVKRLWEKMRPANTKKFFTHWRGRSDTRAAPRTLMSQARHQIRPTNPPSNSNDVAELSEGAGGVARVQHETRLVDQPPRRELGVRGQ